MPSRPFAGSWLCTTACVCNLFQKRIGELQLVTVEGEEKAEGGLVEIDHSSSLISCLRAAFYENQHSGK